MRKKSGKHIHFKLTFLLLFVTKLIQAQEIEKVNNWQNLDLKTDHVFGVSTEKAYAELLKNKIASPVIVAVIDGGIDINHEDLKSSIWINPKEIAGNGKDDDDDGYIDDVNGWNFLGSSKGSFHFDNLDLIRELRAALRINSESAEAKKLNSQLVEKLVPLDKTLQMMEVQRNALKNIIKVIGKQYPTSEDFKKYRYRTAAEANVILLMVNGLKEDPDFINKFEEKYQRYRIQKDYMYNINYDPRAGNKEFQEKTYGNSDVKGSDPSHGTHIAGIIVANRENEIGIKGIAGEAKIMCLTAVPEGDAMDENMAHAIRYATDHGARIINISSGKGSSYKKYLVDEAVKYAMEKDVLIVHAGGNRGLGLDTISVFPTRNYLKGDKAQNWIEVGASNDKDDQSLLAWFSNYGKKVIDVFAPGVGIYSTYPENKYAKENGTSMAAPVVSGLAALIWSYYPELNAAQVKEIIMSSVVKVQHPVKNSRGNMLNFSDACLTGGIVNAFNAMQLADKIGKEKK